MQCTSFQSFMNGIYYECIDVFLVICRNDLLIFRKDKEGHFNCSEIVLGLLKKHDLYVSSKKCEFMKEGIDFLEIFVGRKKLRVNPNKIIEVQT